MFHQGRTMATTRDKASDRLVPKVKQIVVEVLELDVPVDSISDEAVIFEGDLAADSIQALEIITGVEDEFGILFDDEELNAELLASVGTLAEATREKLHRLASAGDAIKGGHEPR